MTRDEIEQMSAGIKIDALIAEKVMQLTTEHLPVCYEESFTDDGLDGWSGFVCPRCHRSEGMLNEPCAKRYSLDIAAAWEVVEKIRQEPRLSDETFARFVDVFHSEYACFDISEFLQILTPLAICRAALLVVLDAGEKQAENP